MIRILRAASDDDQRRPGRTPPPDYLSRGVQYRLMVLVGMLMLVILLMDRVRDPKVWAWMFSGKQAAKPNQQERTPPALDPQDKDASVSSPLAPLSDDVLNSRMWQAQVQSWGDVLKVLGRSDRAALGRFLQHLRQVDGKTPKAGKKKANAAKPLDLPTWFNQPRWRSMLRQLDQRWTNYVQEIDEDLLSNTKIQKQEKAEWIQVASKLELQWTNRTKPALSAPVDQQPLTVAHRAALKDLQRVVDYLDLQQVEDFTIGFRHRELVSWNRLWEILKNTPQKKLEQSVLGPAKYLQLFRQPKHYRGKLLRIKGVARAGYKSQRGIYVLGVQLTGGPPDPVLVHLLELPEGFPNIADENDQFNPRKLNEPVSVAGYFFKCLRYSTDMGTGAGEAPLVMAKTLSWKPAPSFSAKADNPQTPILIIGIVGVSLFAVAFAWWAWRSSQSTGRREALAESEPFSSLADEDIPTVGESLQSLAESEE